MDKENLEVSRKIKNQNQILSYQKASHCPPNNLSKVKTKVSIEMYRNFCQVEYTCFNLNSPIYKGFNCMLQGFTKKCCYPYWQVIPQKQYGKSDE